MKKGIGPLEGLLTTFESLEDPRIDRKKLYPLIEIVFLTVSAVISGFDEWEEIVDFGEEKLGWLQKFLPYVNGIPSHDTINRVISLIDYRQFETCFIDWTTNSISFPQGLVINIDGKKLRSSVSKGDQQLAHSEGGKSALHIVQAWCGAFQMCLGQYKTETKSNEITAIPALLDLLEIEGCTITIDAMGCQKAIAEKIIDKKGNYLLAVKGNQENLYQSTAELFEKVIIPEKSNCYHVQTERNHGRNETRICRVLPAKALPEWSNIENWPAMQSIIEIKAHRQTLATGKTESETRYYISSLPNNANAFNDLIRSHWNIENQLHWTLDVQFGEDSSRKRVRNAAQNFSTIRKIALNLIKANSDKISVNRKRNKCALSDEYRQKILKI